MKWSIQYIDTLCDVSFSVWLSSMKQSVMCFNEYFIVCKFPLFKCCYFCDAILSMYNWISCCKHWMKWSIQCIDTLCDVSFSVRLSNISFHRLFCVENHKRYTNRCTERPGWSNLLNRIYNYSSRISYASGCRTNSLYAIYTVTGWISPAEYKLMTVEKTTNKKEPFV